jgi:Calcineurin-like phosphoesterase
LRLSLALGARLMKRFDFANDGAKQLITIASAIITVVIAFYEKFFSHSGTTFVLVFVVLLILIVSITFGVMTIGGLVNLVERQEESDWNHTNNPPSPAEFTRLGGTGAQTSARWQQGLFAAGLVLFILVATLDRLCLSGSAPKAAEATQSTAAQTERPIVWAQVRPDEQGAGGELIARAVVGSAAECPDAIVGAARLPITARSNPSDPDFPRTICEVTYDGAQSAAIADVKLAARPLDPESILVLGDTGCRVTHYAAQECNRDESWPFRMIAEAAARLKPQLIIHVGDYHYREKACSDRAGCTGSPHGDTWSTWKAEFFEPARALLPLASWIMVRGNHENCERAGAGWLLLLAPELRHKLGRQCQDDTAPYLLRFKDLTLAVFDVAAAGDEYGRADRVKKYQAQIQEISSRLAGQEDRAARKDRWLLLHQPPWVSYGNCQRAESAACVESDFFHGIANDSTVAADLKNQLRKKHETPLDTFRQWFERKIQAASPSASEMLPSPGFSLVLAGDTHMFQMFAPDRERFRDFPLQVVAGMSGDQLENEADFSELLKRADGTKVELFGVAGSLWARLKFGFLMLTKDRTAGRWMASFHDVNGNARMRCDLAKERCEPI